MTLVVGDEAADVSCASAYDGNDTISYSSTKLALSTVTESTSIGRKTKIICTMGPRCWGEEEAAELLSAGMNVAALSFAAGTLTQQKEVLDRLRKVTLNNHADAAQSLHRPWARGRPIHFSVQRRVARAFLVCASSSVCCIAWFDFGKATDAVPLSSFRLVAAPVSFERVRDDVGKLLAGPGSSCCCPWPGLRGEGQPVRNHDGNQASRDPHCHAEGPQTD